MLDYPIRLAIAITIICILFIVFGHANRESVQAKLQRPIAKLPASEVDYWSISHFMLFAIYGYLIPGYPLTFLSIGVLWEMTEDMLSSSKNTKLTDCKQCSNLNSILCNGYEDGYWYGKWDDIIFNTLGYLVGSAFSG